MRKSGEVTQEFFCNTRFWPETKTWFCTRPSLIITMYILKSDEGEWRLVLINTGKWDQNKCSIVGAHCGLWKLVALGLNQPDRMIILNINWAPLFPLSDLETDLPLAFSSLSDSTTALKEIVIDHRLHPSPSPPLTMFALSDLYESCVTLCSHAPLSHNLTVLFPPLSLFFSLCFSTGMLSCWLSLTVEPVSLLALWCSLCWASWLQSKAWTSVR